MPSSLILGIDLGTTNSAAAVFEGGQPRAVEVDGQVLLPSCVGVDGAGRLIVGQAARNQIVLYPERTVKSFKRMMGKDTHVTLGEQKFTPTELSAVVLRRLKQAAEAQFQQPIHEAVITVPAYFSDAQRTATKEAGEIAGFEVRRILNEPTAAALCYLSQDERDRTFLVYDLGGGTFDVSILRSKGKVTEVLASHGDTALGGDDFDRLLYDFLVERLKEQHPNLAFPLPLRAQHRLLRAAESAKIELSTESYAQVIEEHLAEIDGVPIHFRCEVKRRSYEELIEPWLQRTRDSVQKALNEAKLLARQLDEVILVGGASYTPAVRELLRGLLGVEPRMDINPEYAVLYGAAIQAARLAGQQVDRILVDVTPFSFGTSCLGFLHGVPSADCYEIVIHRNTPLPTRQTEVFCTSVDYQAAVDVKVFQGEDPDARRNLFLGEFWVEGLDKKADAGSEILFDMRLDLNGMLDVQVTEKHTGLRKGITIKDAFRKLSPEEREQAQQRIRSLWDDQSETEYSLQDAPAHGESFDLPSAPEGLAKEQQQAWLRLCELLKKAQQKSFSLEQADREELLEIIHRGRGHLERTDLSKIAECADELNDVLFYLD